MKHKYIKNFTHLVNLINSIIKELTDAQLNELRNEFGGIGEGQFYYDYVYSQEYCDAFAYAITKQDFRFLGKDAVKAEYETYFKFGEAYGRKWSNYNKFGLLVEVPDDLKDK